MAARYYAWPHLAPRSGERPTGSHEKGRGNAGDKGSGHEAPDVPRPHEWDRFPQQRTEAPGA